MWPFKKKVRYYYYVCEDTYDINVGDIFGVLTLYDDRPITHLVHDVGMVKFLIEISEIDAIAYSKRQHEIQPRIKESDDKRREKRESDLDKIVKGVKNKEEVIDEV